MQSPPSSRGLARRGERLLVLAVASLLATTALVSGACGFGVYDDSGQPVPGSWWPWVCSDGGPASDAGCLGDSAEGGAVE